jgi:hypothetical protein
MNNNTQVAWGDEAAPGDWSISDPVLGLSIIAEILIFIEC